MYKYRHLAPIVKWAGGKRQLLPSILPMIPKRLHLYCEPFFGGGAVFFARQPQNALINDINPDLMEMYAVVRDDVEGLIADLKRHKNTEEYFYALRNLDRDKEAFAKLSPLQRASRLIYLNKTCYNGLYRVNSAGEFNTPYGRYKNPNIVNRQVLHSVSRYLNHAQLTFASEDFEAVLSRLPKGAFVYLDPPYDPLSETANFTGYVGGGFSKEEQLRLKNCCDDLTRRGIRFILSNSATPFILNLYHGYNITFVDALRAINSVGAGRGAVREVLVTNYGPKRRGVGKAVSKPAHRPNR